MKRLLMVVGLLLLPLSAGAGNRVIREYVLWNGAATDTLEMATPWINVFGASRVVLRMWSGKAAFNSATDADSIYSDSLTTFKIVMTDSVVNYKAAAETLMVDGGAVLSDTVRTMVTWSKVPINRELRGPTNGSGIITIVGPTNLLATASAAISGDPANLIFKKYMRFRFQPLRRHTAPTSSAVSPGGKRVIGLKNFRARLYVVFDNQ